MERRWIGDYLVEENRILGTDGLGRVVELFVYDVRDIKGGLTNYHFESRRRLPDKEIMDECGI